MSGSGIGRIPYQYPLVYEIIQGKITNFTIDNCFGNNNSLGSSDEEIWNVGGIESLLTSAETMDTVSDDPDDTLLGTGARTLLLNGLDNSYNSITEVINLNGTTPVTSTSSFLRVFSATILTAGSSGFNEGAINVTSTTSGFTHSRIDPQDNKSAKTQYTVPANKLMVIGDSIYGVGRNDEALGRLFIRPFGSVFQLQTEVQIFESTVSTFTAIPSPIPPLTDISFRARNTGAGSVKSTLFFTFYLIDIPS